VTHGPLAGLAVVLGLAASLDFASIHPQCFLPQTPPRSLSAVGYPLPQTFSEFVRSISFVGTLATVALPLIAMLVVALMKAITNYSARKRAGHSRNLLAEDISTPISAPSDLPVQDETQNVDIPVDENASVRTDPVGPSSTCIPPLIEDPASLATPSPPAPSIVVPPQSNLSTHRIDDLERASSVLFVLQFGSVTKVATYLITLTFISNLNAVIGAVVLSIEVAVTLRLLLHIRSLQGSASFFGRQFTTLSKERLQRQLRFLISKYASYAPYWQFLLLSRQFAANAVFISLENHPSWQAIGVATVLTLTLILHVYIKPYIHGYQHSLELLLLASELAYIAIVMAQRSGGHTSEWSLVALLLGPVIVNILATYMCSFCWSVLELGWSVALLRQPLINN
jgi:hypothetical protein